MSFRGSRGGRGMGNGRFQGGGRDMDGGRGGGGGNRNANRGGGDPGNRGVSNHTSDAAMAGARIFVGNLPTADSRLSKELLEDTFGQYGRILGISILKGFGFIQYAEEMSAENAIRGAQNIEILDHRMDVKPARVGGKDGAGGNSMASPESSSLAGGGNNFRDRSPLRRRDSFDIPGGPMRMGGGGGPMGRGEPDMGRPGDMMMGPRGGGSVRDYDGRPSDREWMGGNNRDFHMDPYPVDPYLERERPRDPFAPPVGADHHRGGFGAPPAPLASMKMANEVEIVVTSKTGPMRQYAERIEGRVRSKGLIVDVLHPHEDIPLRQILGDLSSRGTLYGIVLTPQNLEHGSLTLNILFGQPEEHRNMPVDDAFDLLSSSFRAYQQLHSRDPQSSSAGRAVEGLEPRIGGGGGPGRLVTDPHPPTMQALLNALQENRPLSIMEYDRLIGYLGERRNRQAAEEAQRGNNQMPSAYQSSVSGGNQDPQELQQRILNILSSSAAGGGLGGGPAPVPVPAPWGGNSAGVEVSSTGPLQDQQQSGSNNVQKALDSLIQTGPNLLKHYGQQQPQQQQQQQHRPPNMMQQQWGNPMGKRF